MCSESSGNLFNRASSKNEEREREREREKKVNWRVLDVKQKEIRHDDDDEDEYTLLEALGRVTLLASLFPRFLSGLSNWNRIWPASVHSSTVVILDVSTWVWMYVSRFHFLSLSFFLSQSRLAQIVHWGLNFSFTWLDVVIKKSTLTACSNWISRVKDATWKHLKAQLKVLGERKVTWLH